MRKTLLMVFLVGVFLLALAAPGSAENQAGTMTLSPFTGLYVFDDKQNMDNGQYTGLRAGYNFTKSLGAEAVFGWVPSESVPNGDRQVNVYRYGIDALYHFMPDSKLVPFIAVGLADNRFDGPTGSPNHNRGMVDYGVGIKWFIADTVALRGDIRRSSFSEGGASRANMDYTVGVTIALGAEKKVGVAIRRDEDTTAPEVVCTNPGSDVTGVAIDRNITATFSKEMNRSMITPATFTVKHGTTPVPGKVTFAGTTATFDPASDLEKGATYTATIVAGVKDLAGNALANSYVWSFTTIPAPKVSAAPVVLIVLEDNHFEFDKSAVTKQGADILDENIKILKANPKMKVRIAGYTSASGTQDYNQKLSERRAVAVREYLIKGGIAPERLTTVGYGEMKPAAYEPLPDNIYSKEAKANMRVLFEVIVQ